MASTLAVTQLPEVAVLHPFGHLAGKLQGLGGDDAHQAEQRDQDHQEQDEAGEGRGQDLIAPQQAGEGMVEGLGGEKQHQRHENVEEIRFDDEVGKVEHQQGDDPEKEPGEPGVQAFLDLRGRARGAGLRRRRGRPGARRRSPGMALAGTLVAFRVLSWLPATIRQKCGFCQAEKWGNRWIKTMSLRAGDRQARLDQRHRPPAGEGPQAGSLCH